MQLLLNFIEFPELFEEFHEILWVRSGRAGGRRGSAEAAPRSATDAHQKALFFRLWRPINLDGIS